MFSKQTRIEALEVEIKELQEQFKKITDLLTEMYEETHPTVMGKRS